MNVLITGGAGFIGSNYLNIVVKKYTKDTFVCFDCLNYAANLDNIKVSNLKNYIFEKGDISNREEVFKLFEKYNFDIVVNFAAETNVDRSINDPSLFVKTNVVGVINLLDACLKYKVGKFHQVSTDEVYGELPLEAKDISFKEGDKLNPSNPYSASKASADFIVLSYYKTYGLNVTISRGCNTYGPNQDKEKFMPLVITKAINDEYIPIYGDGKNIRDWIHVKDHCRGIELAVRNGKPGEIYNISSKNEMDNLSLVKLILSILDKPESLIKFVEDRKGHDKRYALDATKISTTLKWKPKYSFDIGIKDTINFYINN